MKQSEFPGAVAIREAGLTYRQVAARAEMSDRHLRRCIREGAPFVTAERLARVIGCSADFFRTPGGKAPAWMQRRGAASCRKGGPRQKAAT